MHGVFGLAALSEEQEMRARLASTTWRSLVAARRHSLVGALTFARSSEDVLVRTGARIA